MEIKFYTPAHGVDGSFGGATFGFVGGEDERADSFIKFPEDLEGIMICGSYAECLEKIPEGDFKAAIVLLGNAGGENEFIHVLRAKLGIPVVGGGAAINPETGEKGLITGQGEAAVFLITDDRYAYTAVFENIHRDILGEYEVSFTNPRVIDKVDGVDAVTWLQAKKAEMGVPEGDFEHLTLSDMNNVNAHLSLADGKICSGRDLTSKMLLRYVSPEAATARIRAFYDDKDAIVFGCAGLKGILDGKLGTDCVGLFMFGEVCSGDDFSEFGNLMLSKIVIKKK